MFKSNRMSVSNDSFTRKKYYCLLKTRLIKSDRHRVLANFIFDPSKSSYGSFDSIVPPFTLDMNVYDSSLFSPLNYLFIWRRYLGNSVESTEKDIETRLTKAWTAINRLSIIWKSDLTDKMKRSFFQAAVTSILLYGCTTWTLTKRLEKKLDGNYTWCVQSWTSPGSSTPQDTNCTATCPLSRKLFKLGEPDMQDIAGEAEMNS